MSEDNACPKCGSSLTDIQETPTGRKLKRCSAGSWDKEARKTIGCDFIKWLAVEPEVLDEKCPKCGSNLVMAITRFGKKMKKCSTGGWDAGAKQATGCDYVEWINGSTEKINEKCPECDNDLVLFTTNSGKKMKKCSTAGWDRDKKEATGCTYVLWLKPGEYVKTQAEPSSDGEEFLPEEPES